MKSKHGIIGSILAIVLLSSAITGFIYYFIPLKNIEVAAEIKEDEIVDVLLEDSIRRYIEKYYVRIPKSVAKIIAKNIAKAAEEEGMAPELIVGVIEVESGFNPTVCSSAGAKGLMQVMDEWVKKLNIPHRNDLYDIDTNIMAGTKVLKIHISEEGGDVVKGLYKYVGKSDSYSDKVFRAMGRFTIFKSYAKEENGKSHDISGKNIKGTATSN